MIDDVNPERPPGFEQFTTIINYVAWAAIIICVLGFVVSAARLGIAYRNGEMEGAKGLVLALVACVIIGGAAGIIEQFT
ncbi:hypothetical protein GGQ54_003348 [Naumannella cuiyingiana]|uniref:Uncharacterized protein n=1 Tax=Naumannella cuiyingiana TaxID=1347891 RepID=A0A7Z0DBV0_9ACTN|nr:hypothetical protein [Naumannella cuiyingiana]NYI72734.1 hypothetical protein [Naumannella cuiyingiana]